MGARQFSYYSDWKKEILTCPRCGWTGTFEEGSVEHYNELMDCSCPKCSHADAPMLAIVSYPTMQEAEANRDKMSGHQKYMLDLRKKFLEEFEAMSLKSPDELPEIEGAEITLTWDAVEEDGVRLTAIRHGQKVIWRERACFEGYERFAEVVGILKKKYGARLHDVVPTEGSWLYLYGDALTSIGYVESVRASIRDT